MSLYFASRRGRRTGDDLEPSLACRQDTAPTAGGDEREKQSPLWRCTGARQRWRGSLAGLATLAAVIAVHDAMRAWRDGTGSPATPAMRLVAYYDEEPGRSRPGDEASQTTGTQSNEWLRYPVAQALACRTEDVLAFVREHGGQVDRVGFRHFGMPGGGQRRGLAARATILEHEIAVSVPLSVCLSLHAALSTPDIGAELKTLLGTGELDEFAALAAFILQQAAQPGSFYRPFLCSLPRHVPLPIFDDPALLLTGPWANDTKYLRAVASIGRVLRDSYTKTRYRLLDRRPDLFGGVRDLRSWLWACAIILSRSWGVSVPPGSPVLQLQGKGSKLNISRMHVLAPVADMVNHDPMMAKVAFQAQAIDSHRNASANNSGVGNGQGGLDSGQQGQESGGSIIVYAGRTLRPGDEILISYGDKCNMELHAHYGFSLARNTRLKCEWDSIVARLCFDRRVTGRCW